MSELSPIWPIGDGPPPTRCPACDSCELEILADLDHVPVWPARLYPGREDALGSPIARMVLASCRACCHVYNVMSDPTYGQPIAGNADESAALRTYVAGPAE